MFCTNILQYLLINALSVKYVKCMDDPISGLKKGLSSGSGDEWESDEEDGKNSQYQLLPQDPPIESEGTANVNSTNSDEDIEQV